ncbi:hypothetical protein MTO96_006337 [Rhipicephalus appendiculatus]
MGILSGSRIRRDTNRRAYSLGRHRVYPGAARVLKCGRCPDTRSFGSGNADAGTNELVVVGGNGTPGGNSKPCGVARVQEEKEEEKCPV